MPHDPATDTTPYRMIYNALNSSSNIRLSIVAKLRTGLMPLVLLYLLVCIPLGLTVYTPYAYQWYCPINPRCELISASFAQQSMQQLTDFLQHQTARLFPPWSHKENLHMLEVRGMYDKAAGLFGLLLLWISYDVWQPNARIRYQRHLRHSSYMILGLVLACLLIMPFFQYFWLHIFHPLLFNNQLWRIDQSDVSWYLMPRQFFMWVIGFIVAASLLLHVLLWWSLRLTCSTEQPVTDR